MRRLLSFPFLAVAASIGCGGVDGPAAPRLITGVGVGDGAISGTLYVHVTDEETREVALDDAGDKITGISNDFATFTH